MKYQAPREAKERDTEEENAHPFSLNYSTFIKHSDVPARLEDRGGVAGGWDLFYGFGIFSFKGWLMVVSGEEGKNVQPRCRSQTLSICDK